MLCKRWLESPLQGEASAGELQKRTLGTPQSGVISHLFLHYAFDKWMERKHLLISFERYADDIVCHVSRMSDASVRQRL